VHISRDIILVTHLDLNEKTLSNNSSKGGDYSLVDGAEQGSKNTLCKDERAAGEVRGNTRGKRQSIMAGKLFLLNPNVPSTLA
jgi:hypothetical protein